MSERPVRLNLSWMYVSSTSQKYSLPLRLQNHAIHEICGGKGEDRRPCEREREGGAKLLCTGDTFDACEWT